MSAETRQLLDELLAARIGRSAERAAQVLRSDARYWDPERGDLSGRDAIAEALTAHDTHLELETLVADDDAAVMEVQVHEGRARRRSTEVYRLQDGAIASIKVYVDPSGRRA